MGIVRRIHQIVWLSGLAWLLGMAGCGGHEEPAPAARESSPPPVEQAPPTAAKPDGRPVIVAFGDSLTAGYGVEPGKSYPDDLQNLLDRRRLPYRVVNAGVSGDTSGGGLMRLGGVVEYKPKVVILELGANDGLRGLPVETTRENLEEIIVKLKAAGAEVVLAGMTLPPNYGPDYIHKFEEVFKDLARKYKLTLIPFLLEGVAGTDQYMQADGLHPNAEGAKRVAATVLKYVEPLLAR